MFLIIILPKYGIIEQLVNHMITYRRTDFAIWSDRLIYPIFFSIIGLGLIVAGVAGANNVRVPQLASVIFIVFGASTICCGILITKKIRPPIGLDLSDDHLTIRYSQGAPTIIKRAELIAVHQGMAAPRTVSHNMIVYRRDGKQAYAAIFSGYRDEQGVYYNGKKMTKRLREWQKS